MFRVNSRRNSTAAAQKNENGLKSKAHGKIAWAWLCTLSGFEIPVGIPVPTAALMDQHHFGK